LLNWLAKRDAAIVSQQAGTTRDIISVQMDIAGFPVTLSDTAGLRVSHDAIEEEGIRRAKLAATTADLKIFVQDFSDTRFNQDLDEFIDEDTLVIFNKIDLGCDGDDMVNRLGQYYISLDTGEGCEGFMKGLQQAILSRFNSVMSGQAVITRERHREALVNCRTALVRALSAPEKELAAEDLRLAVRALGVITGRVDVEDLLDVIFSEFCIGK
jgi:tRNA modification GTPase